MTRRTQIAAAAGLFVVGGALLVASLGGSGQLHAAGFSGGIDITKILVYGGIGLLVVSALLFVSASAE